VLWVLSQRPETIELFNIFSGETGEEVNRYAVTSVCESNRSYLFLE